MLFRENGHYRHCTLFSLGRLAFQSRCRERCVCRSPDPGSTSAKRATILLHFLQPVDQQIQEPAVFLRGGEELMREFPGFLNNWSTSVVAGGPAPIRCQVGGLQPEMQLVFKGEHGTATADSDPVHRKLQFFLPALHGAHTSTEVGSNFLPGVQDVAFGMLRRLIHNAAKLHQRLRTNSTLGARALQSCSCGSNYMVTLFAVELKN